MEAEEQEEVREANRLLGLAHRACFAWPVPRMVRMLRQLARQAEASAEQLEAGRGGGA